MILRGDFFSTTLEMETGITLLLPNQSLNKPSHQLVYLLHGLCGRSGDWLDYSMLPVFAEKYNLMFVMPEVARSFYSDMAFGQNFFSYITDELPRVCQSAFNVSAAREDTAVIGASMGGYAALKCALSRPEQYGYCAAFSSACLFLQQGLEFLRSKSETAECQAMFGPRLINDFKAIFGENFDWTPECDILQLAQRLSQQNTKPVIYTTCGTEDPFYADHQRFSVEMDALEFDFTHYETAGAHDWNFFNHALEQTLERFFVPA